jgi:hypothetical protein
MAHKEKDILTGTAKALGSAAGKIASLAGVGEHVPMPGKKTAKPEKLQKKNKSRLPRRQKKEQKKAAMATSAPARSK